MFLHTITDACTPVCLFAAITSVEAVTPPYVKPIAINSTVTAKTAKSNISTIRCAAYTPGLAAATGESSESRLRVWADDVGGAELPVALEHDDIGGAGAHAVHSLIAQRGF